MTTQLPPNDPNTDDKLPGEDELLTLYHQLPKSEPRPALDAAILAAASAALKSNGSTPTISVERSQPARPIHESHATAHRVAAARRKSVPRWLIGLSSAATLMLAAGLAWHRHDMPETTLKSTVHIDDSRQPMLAAAKVSSVSNSTSLVDSIQAGKQANDEPLTRLQRMKAVSPAQSGARSRDSMTAYTPNEASAKQQANLENAEVTRRAVLQKHAASAPRQAASADGALMAVTPPAVMETFAPAAAPQNESDTRMQASDTPEQELAKIQQLMQQKHQIEARQRLQVFMRAHPQWDLPPDLRDFLNSHE